MAKTATARRATATQKTGAASAWPAPAEGGDMNAAVQAWGPVGEYVTDAMQRTILFWDVMRQRSAQYYEQKAKAVPHVLSFDAELVLDGRTFAKPVNYLLVRIHAPDGMAIDPRKRPFVVVDPRAGHGPGIGGFKADSELGVAMRAGHPAYFVGFTPDPMPGQTIEDIMHAEAVFLEKVIALHPGAEGKPCVIGNCQAGWAVLLVAAIRPELFGPIIVPGSPLSYWAGIEGENPMRYTGGLAGGSWMTALAGDLGNGKFDGGMLVENFENLNPSNTLWTKNYNLWAKVDSEGPRFIEFEKWWGGHVNLNAEEIQWIVDQLFVGNRLATAEIVTAEGERVDLRNIRSPIICFCSKGDNITPPQQALGWIVDLYGSDDDIRACGQTIVYSVHESVGHLGIFVSGGVAKKEHQEFASNVDLIDVLPPGLYEAVMSPRSADDANPEAIGGDWIVRFEPRTIDDIRAIVQPERRERAPLRRRAPGLGDQPRPVSLPGPAVHPRLDQRPERRVAEEAQPGRAAVRGLLGAQSADAAGGAARRAGARAPPAGRARQPAAALAGDGLGRDHPGARRLSRPARSQPGEDLPRDLRLAGGAGDARRRVRRTSRRGRGRAWSPKRVALIEQRIAELKAGVAEGGAREAAIRALVYIGMAGPGVDERAFNTLREIRAEHDGLTLEAFKRLLRAQYFSLVLDQAAALAAIPKMLPADSAKRASMLEGIRRTVRAAGAVTGVRAERLAQVERLFAGSASSPKAPRVPRKATPAPRRARRSSAAAAH